MRRSIHSSRPPGAKFHVAGRAWIQYSRLRPPGWGCGVPKLSLSTLSPDVDCAARAWGATVAVAGGAVRAFCLTRSDAERSASWTSLRETFSSFAPPTAHSSAVADPASRKERRSKRRLMRVVARDDGTWRTETDPCQSASQR